MKKRGEKGSVLVWGIIILIIIVGVVLLFVKQTTINFSPNSTNSTTANSTNLSRVIISTDQDHLWFVTFTANRNGDTEQKFQYAYDNDTTIIGTQPLLAWINVNVVNSKGVIHVLEGEDAQVGDAIVVSSGNAGRIVRVDSIDTEIPSAGQATVTLTDLLTGNYQKITLTNDYGYYSSGGVGLWGGTGYIVRANKIGTNINITWSGYSTNRTLFPRIELTNGGWIAFLTETKPVNNSDTISIRNVILPFGPTMVVNSFSIINTLSTNGLSTYGGGGCNFDKAHGPAILYIDPSGTSATCYTLPSVKSSPIIVRPMNYQNQTQPYVPCMDSDGGINLFVKGTTSGIDLSTGIQVNRIDSCSGTSVLEYYCIGDVRDGKLKVTQQVSSCTYGNVCYDGVCIES